MKRLKRLLQGWVELAYGVGAWYIIHTEPAVMPGWSEKIVHHLAEAGVALFVFFIARKLSIPDSLHELEGRARNQRQNTVIACTALIIAAAFIS